MNLMSKVVNIVGSSSNVGKTYLLEGLIKELKFRGYSIATIKHDVHGFDIDYADFFNIEKNFEFSYK